MPSKVENLGQKVFLVLLAETKDVACNEAVNILRSLKRTLEVATTNVIVFSIPHRHDLAPWSCVNAEIRKTNEMMKRICKIFKNCNFIDISELVIGFMYSMAYI